MVRKLVEWCVGRGKQEEMVRHGWLRLPSQARRRCQVADYIAAQFGERIVMAVTLYLFQYVIWLIKMPNR